MAKPYSERRAMLESLEFDGQGWTTSETFDDGPALYAAVCNLGLEGVVAKKLTSRYQPSERGSIKLKNPDYWRRDSEITAIQRSRERRLRPHVKEMQAGSVSSNAAITLARGIPVWGVAAYGLRSGRDLRRCA